VAWSEAIMTKANVFQVFSAVADEAPTDGHAVLTLETSQGPIVLSMSQGVFEQMKEQAAHALSRTDKP
jgi:predicted transglutaminase-like cysteine proteinase